MDKDLKEAMELLAHAHAAIWTHFDPDMDKGSRLQPKHIRALLKQIRLELSKNGIVMEGFKRGE